MKIAGVIAEYNPFHNGHAWHLRQTRALTGCDYIVVCMAGNFTQRGEAACASKWARARAALLCGADAVFELPTLFAVRPAEAFAAGSVAILGGLGADALCFGCETDDPALIRSLAMLKQNEPETFSRSVRRGLDMGMSHARAWGEAAGAWLGLPAEAVNQPNLILAAEYLRAMARQGYDMQPVPVKRRGEYHGGELGEYASASALRSAFERGQTEQALVCVPETARDCAMPDAMHPMDDLLLYRLREMSIEQLSALPDMGEGLEHRLYRLCRRKGARRELLEALKCKRYTYARLSRVLTYALLGMDAALIRACPLPPYARLLGARRGTEALLAELKRRTRIPIAPRAAALRGDTCFEAECRATDIWALLHDAPDQRLPGREYRERFISV